MKKILFVSHEFLVGGSTSALLSLIQGIQELSEFKVEVLIPRQRKSEAKAKRLFEGNHIKYKELFYRNDYSKIDGKNINYIIKRDIYNIINTIAVFKLYFYLKKNKYDIVCSNSSGVDIGARAALLANIPHIYYIREFMEEDLGAEYRNIKRMKKLFEQSEGVIFISKAIRQKYTGLYKFKKYTQFYEGVITENYFVQDHVLFIGENIKIIQLGTLSEGKGTFNTLRIFKLLKDKGINNIEIEFVGNGNSEYINKIRQFIFNNNLEKNVSISGFSDNVKNKLCNKDIILVNSRMEGFGRVTVEGMLAGCLVIGRNSGGTKEIIENGRNGLLFNDEEEFVGIMTTIESHVLEYREIARTGQTWAKTHYDYKVAAKKFLDFI